MEKISKIILEIFYRWYRRYYLTLKGRVVCLCFFLLRPPPDVTMHALHFLSRERVTPEQSATCDEKRKEGKGEMDYRPLDEKWTSKLHFPFPFLSFFVTGRNLSSKSCNSLPQQKMQCMHCDVKGGLSKKKINILLGNQTPTPPLYPPGSTQQHLSHQQKFSR